VCACVQVILRAAAGVEAACPSPPSQSGRAATVHQSDLRYLPANRMSPLTIAPVLPTTVGEVYEEKKADLVQEALAAPTSNARDFTDPAVRFESETTHRGEFGTRRDLVSSRGGAGR
jgi:hypothetical protein